MPVVERSEESLNKIREAQSWIQSNVQFRNHN